MANWKRFFKKKRFWLALIIFLGLGFFLYSLFPQIQIPQEVREKEGAVSAAELPISSIYRYDFEKREYIFDQGGSWQNSDFTRFIYDWAPEGRELERCYYFLYDNIEKRTTAGGQRRCNFNLIITVGENKTCLSQGENACTLYVYARDSADQLGEYGTATYHIDWQRPEVGKIQKENKTYLAEVSDNLEVGYCGLYLAGENVGSMKIENGLAFLEYSFEEKESYPVFARCADHYDAERERYLNISSGELTQFVVFKNQPPEISFCRVSPTQGSKETNFSFQVEASDPDGDNLSYKWDFGDGKNSDEENPSHYYSLSGIFEPKVIVSDDKGEKVSCSTAWVDVK